MSATSYRTPRVGPRAAAPLNPERLARGGRLPRSLTTFVGRAREIAEVRQLMATSRLLTLTGPGGIGKTRLALQVSATIQDERLSDVILVELADVVDSERVAQTIASALGVPEEVSKPVQAALLGRLESRELVLVLDNCEHLLSACAALAGVLLQSCPMLRILVTSREPLRIGGETIWRVPSLALPVGGLPVDVAGAEAVQLFVERARAIVAGFAVTDHNAWAVAQVCRRLDGIPLAIELAAAWVHVLSVEQIADRLSAALQLLVGGSRLAPERQQTLRATVDWSYGLLSDREQRVFERLSVCAGGWTLEAAESICAGDGIEPTAVLELLARLVNASLVACERSPDGAVRYRMLETLRQYGHEHLLMRAEMEVAGRRHAAFMLDLAESIASKLHWADQRNWLNVLEQEHDNFRAALKCFNEYRDSANALRMTGALAGFWLRRGYVREGRDWLERSLVAGADAAPALRMLALRGAGSLAAFDHDFQSARAVQSEALALARTLGDQHSIAVCLNSLGYTELSEGNYPAARGLLADGLDLFRTLEDPVGIALCLFALANLAATTGDNIQAAALFTESLAQVRGVGDTWRIAACLHGLGHLAWREGNVQRATSLLRESLRGSAELRDQRGIAVSLESLALVLSGRRPAAAARLFGAASALRSETGARRRGWLDGDYDRGLERVRSVLGEAVFNAAWAAGRARSADESVGDALADTLADDERSSNPLTRREGEVARLVTRGLTNRQIGDALVITEGTAALHVKNALNKLGFNSRAQLAAWATQQPQLSIR